MVQMNRQDTKYLAAVQAYLKGQPILSDSEFDELKAQLKEEGSSFASSKEPKCYIGKSFGAVQTTVHVTPPLTNDWSINSTLNSAYSHPFPLFVRYWYLHRDVPARQLSKQPFVPPSWRDPQYRLACSWIRTHRANHSHQPHHFSSPRRPPHLQRIHHHY